MTDPEEVTMGDAERDEFLGDGGTGVLSFSTGTEEAPHSIPVSYGYDTEENDFYFRLAVGHDSLKESLLENPVTFVTYAQKDDRWLSVIAKGRLHETMEKEIASETIEGLERVYIPLVDIFGEPPADVAFEFYRLDPEEIGARKETPTEL
jgi:hypothetical protein